MLAVTVDDGKACETKLRRFMGTASRVCFLHPPGKMHMEPLQEASTLGGRTSSSGVWGLEMHPRESCPMAVRGRNHRRLEGDAFLARHAQA